MAQQQPHSSSPSFILISPKKAAVEQQQQIAAAAAEDRQIETVSRRRMAFRPNSIKRNNLMLNNLQKIDSNDGRQQPQQIQESEKSIQQSQQQQLNSQTGANEMDKSRRIQWTLPEQSVFYEALKVHGKDFDAIVKFMNKRKINKDKEQIRNFFLNNYKLWKGKAQIDESEWANIPRDSRELFFVINGCEWRKRVESSFDQQKFKQLILDGVVSFRPKRKKFIITIRTPYCPALLKYFPYDKRGADIPTHVDCKLKPLNNGDREYIVIQCEQNPYVQLHLNINDKIASIFDFLAKKWLPIQHRIMDNNDPVKLDMLDDRIKLFVDGGTQIHKILIGIDEENSPLLSVNRLKKDFQLRQCDENSGGEAPQCSTAEQNAQNDSLQKDTATTTAMIGSIRPCQKEIFEINEQKIRLGLTRGNVGNASMLQLFYLLGMNTEIVFNYQICYQNYNKTRPWELFISLVANRDYDELMAKSAATAISNYSSTSNQQIPTTNQNNIEEKQQQKPEDEQPSTSSSSMAKNTAGNRNDIMEAEKMRFIQQIREQTKRRPPRRQIKLVHDGQKICNRFRQRPPPQMVVGPKSSNQNQALTRFFVLNGVVTQLDPQGSVNGHQQPQNGIILNGIGGVQNIFDGIDQNKQQQCSVAVTDYSSPAEPPNKKISLMNQNHPINDLAGEISLDSISLASPFHTTLLDNSPNKSLPHDVRDAMSEMLKESSVDYCKKFERLTRMHREIASPTSTKLLATNSHSHNISQDQSIIDID